MFKLFEPMVEGLFFFYCVKAIVVGFVHNYSFNHLFFSLVEKEIVQLVGEFLC